MLTTALAFYLGASLGHSNLRADDYGQQVQDALTTLFAVSNASLDMDRAAGGRIFGGVEVAPWLALEVDYTNVGTIANRYDFISIHGAIVGHSEVQGSARMDALGLSAIARTPEWNGFSGQARVGVARTRLRGSQESCFHNNFPPGVSCVTQGADVSQTRPVAGLGIDYRLSHCWQARLGWDRYFRVGRKLESGPSASIPGRGEFDVDFFALGAQYRF
jgi:hypothetical protein